MSLKNQLSFASGELDPILHDRVTLERFQNGLATARNVMIGKTGSILSRFSTTHISTTDHAGPVKLYSPPGSDYMFEFGVRSTNNKFYFIIHSIKSTGTVNSYEEPTSGDAGIDVNNLSDLQFTADGLYIYLIGGTGVQRIRYRSGIVNVELDWTFDALVSPLSVNTSGPASGYEVDYAITYVKKGEESKPLVTSVGGINKPVSVNEQISLVVTVDSSSSNIDDYNEVRIYRRPRDGSAFGFLGTTSYIYDDAGTLKANFTDVGADSDFSNGIPSLVTKEGISSDPFITDHELGTATIYQGRLILGNFIGINGEAMAASRPNFKENFYRDFPYDGDSALLFKTGSEGNARVLRMVDSDGLVVFTDKGVFVSSGILSVNNLSIVKRGAWVIDKNIPPLVVPGALLFVDKTTNTVRQLVYSRELQGYDSIDQSIFSGHLFEGRNVTSWAFQQGAIPLVIVTFSDGTFATFTFNIEHKMRAWTRHDSVYPVEQVAETSEPDTSFFLINKNGSRQITKSFNRKKAEFNFITQDFDLFHDSSFMDSLTVQDKEVQLFSGVEFFTATPLIADDWSGQINISSNGGDSFYFYPGPSGPGPGEPGSILRLFHPVDRSSTDVEVVTRVDGDNITVQPVGEFPSDIASSFRSLYETFLQTDEAFLHLADEYVSVIADGNVFSSPNNDNSNDSVVTSQVSNTGVLTLPERAAIIVVGRPITADVKTLNVSTVEQSPTTLESLTANKLYIRVHNSNGLYVDNEFPENKTGDVDGSTVKDMQPIDDYDQQSGVPIIGNRYKQPKSKRIEVTIPGAWDSQGQMAIRQVDPVHFEVLSIIADLEIERRGRI